MGIDDVRNRSEQQRVSIRICTRCNLRRDEAARTAAVIHDHLLPESCAQLLRSDSAEYVSRATRRETHDETHWPIWITLPPRTACEQQHEGKRQTTSTQDPRTRDQQKGAGAGACREKKTIAVTTMCKQIVYQDSAVPFIT
jgi:hypothetical protein